MPHQPKAHSSGQAVTSYGQIIEYIPDRIFLASYTHAPDEHTPFPWPAKSQPQSPVKRGTSKTQEVVEETKLRGPPEYFSIDKLLLYNAFHADFGPLHIGHLYRFAVMLHDVLGAAEAQKRPIVFWSQADARSRANAACILACYMVIIQSWPPHLALAPIAQMDPPCMPFRDAGYSQADYGLTIQDVVYGIWKAKEEKLCAISGFNLEEYETFERVDMGDFNWISPSFVAFASPQSKANYPIVPGDPLYSTLPRTLEAVKKSSLSKPFKNVLSHFSRRNVGLVVRLNSELYSPSYFTALGIKHLDMIFDDGTCPPLKLVRKFINLAHEMITQRKKGIAVHCKAGLGRTGCLIGAYLIYRHGFTANEVIAYMRFMRPGMVVGPQQHWLHLNQGTFREWWFEDTVKEQMLASMAPSTPTKNTVRQKLVSSNGQTFTPPPRDSSFRRSALGEITHNEQASLSGSIGVQDENLPAPTPGQPRKTNKIYGQGSPFRKSHRADENLRPEGQSLQQSTLHEEDESEEDYAMQLLSSAISRQASRSPQSRSGKRRAVSCTTTTMTTTKWDVDGSDIENQEILMDGDDLSESQSGLRDRKPKTPSAKSGSGIGSLLVNKRSPSRRSTEGKTSVRKTSGRVGSVGSVNTRSRGA
ncbi:hypothetical protein ANO11243_039570 [Dothideomycetidae sp. 11243]|nr:hypothetical protein ANO11243_039570 [fungal sp. No.11243]